MKTSTRITTLLSVFLFALVASAEFVYQVSFEADAAPTLMFGIVSEDKASVPYPPYGTPADGAINHIFFVGSGNAASPQAVDFGQLACSYYTGLDSDKVVWQLQSISDAKVYFKLVSGAAPASLTIDDGEVAPVAIDENPVAIEKGKTYFIRANGSTIKPIGTLEVSVIGGNDSFSFKEPYPEGYEITESDKVYAFKADGTAIDANNITLASNNGVINVANGPADAAYLQYGFEYKAGEETLNSVVVVEIAESVSTELTGIAYAAYEGDVIATDDEDNEIKGDADPTTTKVFNVPTTDDAKTVYLSFTYGIATALAANEATLAVDYLPVTDQYEVVTDAASPAGATRIVLGDTTKNANDECKFTGLNIPANSTATLTLVLKLGADAAQANVLPSLTINGETLDLTAVYVNPVGTNGTLDIDGNGIVNEEDALMFYLFVALGGVDDPDGMYVDDITQGIDETVVDAEKALENLKKLPAFLDYDGNGIIAEEDALMFYLFVALGGMDDPDGMYVDDITQGIDETIVDAEKALETFKKYAHK